MASEAFGWLAEDAKDVFFTDFATIVTLRCGDAATQAPVIFERDPGVGEWTEEPQLTALARKSDIGCEKPVIECAHGEFATLRIEDDLSGVVRLVLSRYEQKAVEI